MATRTDDSPNNPVDTDEDDFFGVKISSAAKHLFDLLDHYDTTQPLLEKEPLDSSNLPTDLDFAALDLIVELNLNEVFNKTVLPELNPADLECLDQSPPPDDDGVQVLWETTNSSTGKEDDFEPEIVFEDITAPYNGQSSDRFDPLMGAKSPKVVYEKITKDYGNPSHCGGAFPLDDIQIVYEDIVDPEADAEFLWETVPAEE